MKIYVTHASSFDFQKELYHPLRSSELNNIYQIILPHEQSDALFSTSQYLKDFDLVIAEVSYPSTGQGIELGWANISDIPILCIYKKGFNPSSGLKMVSQSFTEYESGDDLIHKLKSLIANR